MAEDAALPGGDADTGGEPVCLLHRVCTECGRLSESAPATTCDACGHPLPADG